MKDNNEVSVEAQMLIRKPAKIVFDAFINPAITTNFWFTKSSGKLEQGKTVTWEWEMYAASANVSVKEITPYKKIIVNWGEPATNIEFLFDALTDDTTYVIIKSYGFQQQGKELIEVIKDNTGGFTTVLDGLKAYLEHNINLRLIADKFPHK